MNIARHLWSIGDALEVTLALLERGRSRLAMGQDVVRDAALLVRARVTLACLDAQTWRPARIPVPIAQTLKEHA